MEAKVRIIFVILMAAAGSGTFTALAGDFFTQGADTCPETGTSFNSVEIAGTPTVHRDTFSPEDTIWFDEFLVVGGDTLLWEHVYGWDYAWQEYGVSPEDTIWFDEFLVVGGDTLLWEQVYGWEYTWKRIYPKLRINFFGLAADWYDPGLLFGFDDLRRYYDTFNVEFIWRNSSGTIYSFDNQFFIPYIAPVADWIEIAINNRTEVKRPLYSYFMPLPPQVHRTSEGSVHRRRSGTENDKPFGSIIRSLFSPESENDF